MISKPEILAPAGDLEKLRFAYLYGADAAYIGGGGFSLRAGAGFSLEEIAQARVLADTLHKKLYVAINLYAHNCDIAALPAYIQDLARLKPDALIVSDPGVFALCRQIAPEIALHISTQANNTNWLSARFWRGQGARRIVLARELRLSEAAEIAVQGGLETEIFVHGAMCISYSGRCLLSAFLTGRDANRGDCSHACRWQYSLQEQRRPGEFFPLEEDARGSYILNSRDLCLIDLIPELAAAGIGAWKIEGRNKSAYYVANTVRVYRAALDAYLAEGEDYACRPAWREELRKISHRDYTTGFALGQPGADAFRYPDGGYIRGYDFAAIILAQEAGWLHLEQRNHFQPGDRLEILLPDGGNQDLIVEAVYDRQQQRLDAARHPRQRLLLPYAGPELPPHPLICRRAAR